MEKENLLIDLLVAYKSYAELLIDELNEAVQIAAVHGWKSSRSERGELFRYKMAEIEKQLNELSK